MKCLSHQSPTHLPIPQQVIRDTVVAAANMDYPKDKLTICVCDDGKNREGTDVRKDR